MVDETKDGKSDETLHIEGSTRDEKLKVAVIKKRGKVRSQ